MFSLIVAAAVAVDVTGVGSGCTTRIRQPLFDPYGTRRQIASRFTTLLFEFAITATIFVSLSFCFAN